MLFVVSPAKNLDYSSPVPTQAYSMPELLDDAESLVQICRQLAPQELGSLMKISDKLAGLNAARFTQWQRPFTLENAKQAVFAFNGDVYAGLDALSLSETALAYSQDHMRILSGLYGVLKPLDLMQAYRLEMGTKLHNKAGKDLYAYWGERITAKLNEDLARLDTGIFVNLASNEYFKAVQAKALKATLVTPIFKDTKNGQVKIISFYAKKARGMMARFILEQQPQTITDLTQFNTAGYAFDAEASTATELVFCRAEQTN